MKRIVVGVDGSPESKRALLQAIEEGRLRRAQVDAVYVFEPPRRSLSDSLIGLPYGRPPGAREISPYDHEQEMIRSDEQAAATARATIEPFIDAALESDPGPRPGLVVVSHDNPAEALIDQARLAELLVIGTRGLGGIKGMLVGSVAQHCIQHARCPMLILPPETAT
jgi:nucleotide-binding universal stress UspA family protein